MTPTHYSPIKLLWATTLFFICLFILVFLVFVYSQQNLIGKTVSSTDDSVSPLAIATPTQVQESSLKQYQSKYLWQVSFPREATLDTSTESTEVERVTVSQLEGPQPKEGFYGYSVDFSVENKTTSLSTFADRDSLKQTAGKRNYFSTTTLANKTGYKVKISGEQDYISYYLPLKDDSKVLIVTTSVAGPNSEENQKVVDQILSYLELLD